MRQEGPGGSTGLAGWLSCHMGIGWGQDPCEDPCTELCLSPSPGTGHTRALPGPWGGRGSHSTPVPLGPSHERVEMGCRNTRDVGLPSTRRALGVQGSGG